MIKWIVTIVVVSGVVVSVFAWKRAHASPVVDTTSGGVTAVTVGSIIQSVASTGTVASNLDVPIKCRASGEVLQVGPKDRTKTFDEGDSVKAGELLLQLDKVDEQRLADQAQVKLDESTAQLEEAKQNLVVAQQQLVTSQEKAQADLASAEAQATDAQAKAARRKALLDRALGTQEDYDTAQTTAAQMLANVQLAKVEVEDCKTAEFSLGIKEQEVKLAEAQVRNDKIAFDNANQQVAYTSVSAPMDGVITAMTVQKGTILSSSTSVVGGASVMTLSDMSRLFILADVDESDIGGVKVGQDVSIKADAFPGKSFSGKVVRIAPQGVNTSNVVTFEVKIEVLSDNKSLLMPEMTAQVKIIEARRDNIVLVPNLAVIRKEDKQIVTVQKPDGTTEDRVVTIGLTDDNNDEVISGLKEGEQVVLHKGATDSRWNANQQQQPKPKAAASGGKK